MNECPKTTNKSESTNVLSLASIFKSVEWIKMQILNFTVIPFYKFKSKTTDQDFLS